MIGPSLDLPKLLSLMAHELSAPAGVVAGYLRLLQQGRAGEPSEAQRKLIDAADRSSAQVAALLGDLSELAKLESGEMPLDRRTMALADLLTGLPQTVSGRTGASSVEITVDRMVPDVEVEVDAALLRRALTTLVCAAGRDPDRATLAARALSGPGLDELNVWLILGRPDVVAAIGSTLRGTRQTFDCWRAGHGLALVLATRIVALHDGEVLAMATRPGSVATLVRLPKASSKAA